VRYAIIAVLLFAVTISAAVAAPSYWLATKSSYVGPIAGTTFYDGPVVQGSATFPLGKSPFYAGTWMSASLEDSNENSGDEVDVFAGWSGKIGAKSLDLGLNYYDMGPIRSCRGDFLAAYTNLSGESGFGKYNIHVEFDASTERSKCPSGLLCQAELYPKALQVGKVSTGVVVAGHPKAFGVPAEWPSFAALDIKVPVAKDAFISVWAQKATGISNGMAEDVIVCGLNWAK
jgi:hypothetical protein